MSLFRATSTPLVRIPPLVSRVTAARSFQSGRVLAAIKEGAPADEGRKQEIENAKQSQLKDQKAGKNQWKDTLASESESIVKADRGDTQTDSSTISELQKESAKAAQKEKDGK